jgi:DNA (cytosine-5)-methyltransferase 1
MTLRVFEAFSGYGSQSIALDNIKYNYKVIGISEIDSYAIKAYNFLHPNTITNFGNIKRVDVLTLPSFDLFTYSFPCQDISIAGNMLGFSKDSKTRSSLLWESYKIIEFCRPKYLLMENVKNIVNVKFKQDFTAWIEQLNSIGYNSNYYILNSKDFGIPQSRERVFLVSKLGNAAPDIPKIKVKINYLQSILDVSFDESLLLPVSSITVEKDLNSLKYIDKTERVAYLYTTAAKLPQSRRIYSDHGLSPTLDTGNVLKIYDSKNKVFRKASGNECLRLMGLKDSQISLLSTISNNKKYELAGNSIVVPVLEHIFKHLLD